MTILEIENAAAGKAKDYVNDWCAFAADVFGIYLDPEQSAILKSVQENKKTSVRSGTGRGKDFIAAVAALCFFYLTPKWDSEGVMVENTKVALTAPTDRQIGNIMFPEISRLFNAAKKRGFALPGRLVGYDIRTENEECFLTGFKADSTNTESWTGFHAANTMFVVTEASGMPELVFNAIEGNLQGNSRLLIVFNDNNGAGYAAESQRSPIWAKYRLDSLNAPNVIEKRIVIPGQVDWDWVNDRVKEWCLQIDESEISEMEGDFTWVDENGISAHYRPNDLFRVKVRGMAPKVSSDVLIPVEWILSANERWKKLNTELNNTRGKSLRLGVDVAGMGRDSSVFCHRYENYVKLFQSIQSGGQANQMEIAGTTKNILQNETDKSIGTFAQAFIDTIGEGAGVYSRLEEQEVQGVHSVKGSFKSEWRGKPLNDSTGQYEFLNMRAYLYWAIRDWLNPANKKSAALPPDAELLQELTETKWKFRSDGKIQIEAKEELKSRIKRSPDKGDALANTFYPVPEYSVQAEREQRNYIKKLASLLP